MAKYTTLMSGTVSVQPLKFLTQADDKIIKWCLCFVTSYY